MRLYQRGKRGTWWLDATIAGERITRSSGTSSKPQAEEWAAKVANDTWRTRRLGEAPRLTWGAAVLDWLQKHGDERRSIETMKDRLRWLSKHLENLILQDITPARLDGILTAYEGANSTRNRFVAEVSKILNYAHQEGWIAAVPAFRRYLEAKPEPRWLTQQQADTLIDELPAHLADMARFSLATGLRESNVRLLRWSQVDTARGVAWITSAEIKNKRALSVPLNADALEVLQRRRRDHAVYVFVYDGHPVWNCSSHAWYKAVGRAKLDGLRWHDLRHTWATWHVMAGTPLPVLQQLGGWSSYSMVLRYAHVAVDYAAGYANGSLRDKSVTSGANGNVPISAESSLTADSEREKLGWLMGLEPTTTGITRQPATSKVLNLNDALSRKRRKTA